MATATTVEYQYTEKQKEAFRFLRTDARYTLLYGGARSGKSFAICRRIIHRAIQYPGSRFLIARLRLIHTRTSIYHETLRPMLQYFLGPEDWEYDKSEYVVNLWNGSEIWLGGFDSKERTEKMLGHEYLDIYFNEASQIGFEAVNIGITRLAQNIEGVTNRGYFDCNPPSHLHWLHRWFIEKLDPVDLTPLEKPEMYKSLLMNPEDNRENLPPGYIEDVLGTQSKRVRERMLYGRWVRPAGAVFDFLDDDAIIEPTEVPPIEFYSAGTDFGLNMACLFIGWSGENVYCLRDHGGFNCTTSTFNTDFLDSTFIVPEFTEDGELETKKKKISNEKYINYCDPAGGERIQEIRNGTGANNSVEPGLDYINTKIERKQFFIVGRHCPGLLSEIYDYARDEQGRIVKVNDHYIDAMRYGIFSPSTKKRWRPL